MAAILAIQFCIFIMIFVKSSINFKLHDNRQIYGGQLATLMGVDPSTGLPIIKNNGEFPYLVSVELYGQHNCGGALIRDDVVLTAAHCMDEDDDISAVIIRAGIMLLHEVSPTSQLRYVVQIVTHESYDKEWVRNDISLIRTLTPFNLNKFVNLIKLPQPTDNFYNRIALIIGWGQIETGHSTLLLKKAPLTLINSTICAELLKQFIITPDMICGIDRVGGLTGICDGDSGGPLIIQDRYNSTNDILVGINSWVFKSENALCDSKLPSVFANIVQLHSWILKELRLKF